MLLPASAGSGVQVGCASPRGGHVVAWRAWHRQAGRVAMLAGSVLSGSVLLPAVTAAATTPFFLVIDGMPGRASADPTGCDVETWKLHDHLEAAGVSSQLLTGADAGMLRRALLELPARAADKSRVIVFCGSGASGAGRLFLLPTGLPAPSDLGRDAINALALSRLAGSGGTVLLDLHRAADDKAAAEAATAWNTEHPSGVQTQFSMSDDPQAAPLVGRLAGLSSFDQDALLRDPPAPAPASDATAIGTAAAGSPDAPSGAPSLPDDGKAPPAPATPDAPPEATPEAPPEATAAPRPKPVPVPPGDQTTRDIQASLRALGLYAGPIRGHDGPETQAAIRHFQSNLGDPVTGVLTRLETQGLIGQPTKSPLPGSVPSSTPPPATPTSATAPAAVPTTQPRPPGPTIVPPSPVRSVQVALLALGMFTGRVTGTDNRATHVAIQRFQLSLNHPATGTLTGPELKTLTGGSPR